MQVQIKSEENMNKMQEKVAENGQRVTKKVIDECGGDLLEDK